MQRDAGNQFDGIKQGSIIRSSYWPEPVEIQSIEDFGDDVRIIGATIQSRQHIDDIISKEVFHGFRIEKLSSDFSIESWKVFLGLECIRYRFASMYDPLLAMHASKVDPLPHQIEAVYGHVLKMPRIRYMIADDPGAGKTIMTGLILKELKLRNLIKKILIVTPGHIKDQWRREMYERFKEQFIVVDRSTLDSSYGENVWQRENHIITSIDFAKRDDVLPSIAAATFDIAVVDEAHKMSAYRYGDTTTKTGRYKLGEAVSKCSDHFLFLTATPHKGDPENFRLLLDLLEPGFYATNEMLQESIKSNENRIFLRRMKEDMKDFDGKPLFLPRQVSTKPFHLGRESPNEQSLYNAVSRYVETQYNKALQKEGKKRNIGFALVILQRRLASSTYALYKSLERRKDRLTEMLEGATKKERFPIKPFDFDEIEDMSEEDRWEEEEIWETLSVAENREELNREIRTIEQLIAQAKDIIDNEDEIKLKELKKSLTELRDMYPHEKDKKILIFTEAKDTLEYLEKKIKKWGFSVNTIHGGMKLEDRVEAESIFKNETQIMVATEAAGEGINLQFCHLMINYDIPWNPNRLEQRMGRIHRYGQQKEVFIFNLIAEDTREGKVMVRLFQKLDEIRGALEDKVFDVLGELLHDISFSQLLVEASANARDVDEILAEIDIVADEEYIAKVKGELEESLATGFIDYTRIKEIEQRAREHRLIPEYTESFFRKAFTKAGGRLRDRKDGLLAIESIPYDIRNIANGDVFKRTHGSLLRKYPRVTFDKEIAFKNPTVEFVCFGHPLFEALLAWIERDFMDSLINGAIFIDPDNRLNGHILFYEGEVRDGKGDIAGKRLFSFYLDSDKDVRLIPSDIIWDLQEYSELIMVDVKTPQVDVESIKGKVSNNAISRLKEYKVEIQTERNRQSNIKTKYGIESLAYLITKLDGELIDLQTRKDKGENVDLAIRNKDERKRGYEQAREDLKIIIKKERSLSIKMPKFAGIIRVIPSNCQAEGEKGGVPMVSDTEIEQIAMDEAMNYEKQRGRTPEDVSAENLGFDVRSWDKAGNVRYIEVKGRAKIAPVSLTTNEWFKAKRFKGDYYLYAVLNCSKEPKLYTIQNPAEKFNPEEKMGVVRYEIAVNDIVEMGSG